jgi:hypothetical protein
MNNGIRIVLAWLPIGVAFSVACVLVYATVQQNYRQSLNDPQIQMAEDAAAAISSGAQPDKVVPTTAVDISTSLSPWLEVYANSGVPLLSSGTLHGELPQVPLAALDAAESDAGKDTILPNENRITWQPEAEVRQALVIVHFTSGDTSGFAVAGRNMREVEDRESRLGSMVLLAWALGAIGSFLAVCAKQTYA